MAGLIGVQQKELIELMQMHFPKMGETQCRMLLNQAQSQICVDTKICKAWFTDTIVAGVRGYDMDDVLVVERVEITDDDGNSFFIPRCAGHVDTGEV